MASSFFSSLFSSSILFLFTLPSTFPSFLSHAFPSSLFSLTLPLLCYPLFLSLPFTISSLYYIACSSFRLFCFTSYLAPFRISSPPDLSALIFPSMGIFDDDNSDVGSETSYYSDASVECFGEPEPGSSSWLRVSKTSTSFKGKNVAHFDISDDEEELGLGSPVSSLFFYACIGNLELFNRLLIHLFLRSQTNRKTLPRPLPQQGLRDGAFSL